MATTKKTQARTPKKAQEPSPLLNEGGQIIDARNLNVTQVHTTTDEQVRTGQFATVVGGEYEGRYGVMTSVSSIHEDGTPNEVIFHTRDDRDEDLTVLYTDLRPSTPGAR